MHITIINDCRDDNARGRQIARTSALIPNIGISFIGVSSDLEAAGNIIDVLDAYGESEGIVLVNVAPRNGKAKKHANGTPFGYFWYKNVLMVSSIDGYALSLVKKLGLADAVNVFDIPTVAKQFVEKEIWTAELGARITNTQFRSYEFLPRVAALVHDGMEVPTERLSIESIADVPQAIWWIDNFGNCKTTLLKKELGDAKQIQTRVGTLDRYDRLADVSDAAPAIIVGSSGIGNERFAEIVVQGKSAAAHFTLSSGDSML